MSRITSSTPAENRPPTGSWQRSPSRTLTPLAPLHSTPGALVGRGSRPVDAVGQRSPDGEQPPVSRAGSGRGGSGPREAWRAADHRVEPSADRVGDDHARTGTAPLRVSVHASGPGRTRARAGGGRWISAQWPVDRRRGSPPEPGRRCGWRRGSGRGRRSARRRCARPPRWCQPTARSRVLLITAAGRPQISAARPRGSGPARFRAGAQAYRPPHRRGATPRRSRTRRTR